MNGHIHPVIASRTLVTGDGLLELPDCVTRPHPCYSVDFEFEDRPRPGNPELKGA